MTDTMRDTIKHASFTEKELKKENARLKEALQDIQLTAEVKTYEFNHIETNRLASTIVIKAIHALNGINT